MNLKQTLQAVRAAASNARRARKQTGVSYWQQAKDILALRQNAVGADDYFYYRIFDPKLHPTLQEKLTYSGWRAFQGEFRQYVKPELRAMAYEKHVFYRLCAGFGLPVARIYAVYAPTPDSFERNHALRTRDDLRRFLETTEQLPVFGKPSNAHEGYGGRAIMNRESDGRLRLIDGTLVTAEALADEIDAINRETSGTYLLVEFLRNSEELRAIAGEALISFRTVMLVRNGEPEIFRVSMQCPGTGAHVSNIRYFAGGSISCGLRPDTGEIFRALTNMGFERQEVTHHPVTREALVGRHIEGWSSLQALAMESARAFSPFRMQHWDFALTTRGPVILEMNHIGNVTAVQRHGPPGLYTEQYLSFRDTHTYGRDL